MFCSDPMSGSHFIAQTSKFLLIDTTAVTLSQGHRNVIQYVSPDSYIFVPNIYGVAQTVLTWEANVVAAADAAAVDAAAAADAAAVDAAAAADAAAATADAAEMNLKHKMGWLNNKKIN